MILEDRGLIACEKVRAETDTICLKFSCGKDSAAMWLRCREIFPNIVPIFHYWVPELEFVEKSVRMYEDYFQTEIIRMPHPNFLNFLADGAFQPPHRWNTIEAYALSTVDYDEPVDWAMQDMGFENYWVAVGIKASDSPIRAKAVATNGAWTPAKKLFYPVADMKKADLIEILEKHKCPLSEDYNIFGRSFDGLQFRYINRIKENYPDDYEKIKAWFPLVDAEFMRAQAYGSEKQQAKS